MSHSGLGTAMSNEQRIAKWREERGRVADEARQERMDEIKRRRDEDGEAEVARRREIVEDLLPSSESLEVARQRQVDERAHRTRRQRRRGALLFGFPTALTIAYFAFVATPMYETRATFAVQSASASPGAPTAGIFSLGAPASTLTDAFSIREFILSPDLLRQLEARDGFTAHFRSPGFDPLARPVTIPVLGLDDYSFYRRRVHVDIDVQASLLTLTVEARSPVDTVRFAGQILDLAQRRVNELANGVDADRITALETAAKEAEAELRDASLAVTRVQSNRGELSPEQTAATYYQVIGGLETQAADIEGRRDSLIGLGLTESPMLPTLNAKLAEIRRQIAAQRGRLAGGNGSGLQTSAGLIEAATLRRDMARDKWQSALRTIEQARLSGLDHKRYLTMVARPVAPTIPTAHNWLYATILVLMLSALLYGLAAVVTVMIRARQR